MNRRAARFSRVLSWTCWGKLAGAEFRLMRAIWSAISSLRFGDLIEHAGAVIAQLGPGHVGGPEFGAAAGYFRGQIDGPDATLIENQIGAYSAPLAM